MNVLLQIKFSESTKTAPESWSDQVNANTIEVTQTIIDIKDDQERETELSTNESITIYRRFV
jgi:hypothetical protein